jgi:predicted nucleic-acid-binding protein
MQRSLDTNVIARAVLNDDPVQSPIARRLLAEPAIVLPGVLMEAYWLLSLPHRLSRPGAIAALSSLLDLPTLTVPDREAVLFALERAAAGADFADMLHLALSGGADMFSTFDQGIAAHAEGAPVPVETL